jgi:hypothetical protein
MDGEERQSDLWEKRQILAELKVGLLEKSPIEGGNGDGDGADILSSIYACPSLHMPFI